MKLERIFVMILLSSSMCFAASLIKNGSFEDDGYIGDIKSEPPTGWSVTMDSKFGGAVEDYIWSSYGDYSARLYSNKTTFTAGDSGVISQQVDLTDTNEIIFDVYLTGYSAGLKPWDANEVTAFVNIDNSPNNIWESNSLGGEYYDVVVPLDSNLTGTHTLSFGIRINVSYRPSVYYWTMWDFAKFDAFCGGFGYLAGDLNRDCYVDFGDIDVLAANWLRNDLAPSEDLIDLSYDGTVNLADFAELAYDWMLCSYWADENCFEVPLDLDGDLNFDGIVNMLDYNVLVANFGAEPENENADLDGSGAVDYIDLAIMKENWLQRSWLYKY